MQFHEDHVTNQLFTQLGVLAQRKGHVVKHRLIGEQSTKLKQHAHTTTHGIQAVSVERGHVLPIKHHLAATRLGDATNQAQHGGFAAARGANNDRDFALGYNGVNFSQHSRTVVVTEGHAVELDEWRHICGCHKNQRPARPALNHNGKRTINAASQRIPSGIHPLTVQPDDPREWPTPPATGRGAYHPLQRPCSHWSRSHR